LDQDLIDLYLDDVHVARKRWRAILLTAEDDGQRVMKQVEISDAR
jgi:hypothetical protein